jgi:Spy/CpxP family protein refolding chaperone
MAHSSGHTPAGKAPDQIISEMKERLNLTEEQAVQFHPIMEEYIEKRLALVQKCGGKDLGGMRSLRNEMQELREKTEKQLETILTETQMEEFRKMQDEQRKKMRDKIRNGGRL